MSERGETPPGKMVAETDILKDQDARDAIVRDLERNVMVLAGAGAGKTHSLIERMVAVIREGVCTVDEMAAITFTRKAAGEMRGRFFRRLREEMKQGAGTREAALVQAALDGIDQCFIGTIHSFCGRLLRERPIEAGLAPDFAEIDEREEAVLRRDVWDRFIQRRYGAADVRLEELEEHGMTSEDLYSFFGRRCANADLRLKETSTSKPNLSPFVDELQGFIDRVAPCIPPNPDKRDKLMLAVRRARHFVANHGLQGDQDAARLLAMFEGSLDVTLKHWCNVETARVIRDEAVPHLQERVIHPALRLWREHAYQLVTAIVEEAVEYYDGVRQEEGKLTFQDLLLRTASLLRDVPRVRSYFQRRYRVLLVDEFQDTDPIQAQILFYLTGSDVAEKDWRKLEPRPGSLFLVGDEKQSIYRFRRADVEIFRFVADRISATGGEVVYLNTSFRSLGNLCRWISDAFPSIFSEDAHYQAAFKPLFKVRPDGIDPHCVRKITVPKVHRNSSALIAAFDAERIAGFIAAAIRGETDFNRDGRGSVLEGAASPGDFLILTRTKGQLPQYAQALESLNIPFDVVGGGLLGESLEVGAFVTMLEVLHQPENPVPYVAYLRGPLVGLSDGELYEFRKHGGRIAFGAACPESVSAPLRGRIAEAVEQLEAAENDLLRLPPAAAMERILERIGLFSLCAVHPDGSGSSRAGNFVRLLSVIRDHAARGWHWGRIVEELRAMIDERDVNLEQMTLEVGRDDVVRIMNVHQAKGLQAAVVFLANPYDTSHEHEPSWHVSRSRGASYISMTVTKPKGDYNEEIVAQPEGWAADKEEEMRYEAAEESRLLYVAATRAENLLVVSEYPEKPDRGPWAPLGRFLVDVPELPSFAPRPMARRAEPGKSYAQISREAADRLRVSKRKSYSLATVTGTNDEEVRIQVSREGRGRDYGIVVHQLFDEAVRGILPDDFEAYVDSAVRGAGLTKAMARDAVRAVRRLKQSSLWQRLEGASKVYTEVPFGSSSQDDRGEHVLRGVIDVVYRDEAGWHIVDYKTDDAGTKDDVAALEAKYRAQLDAYQEHWSRLADAPVVDATLWLVHGPPEQGQLALFE